MCTCTDKRHPEGVCHGRCRPEHIPQPASSGRNLPRCFSGLLVAWHLLVDSWLMKEGRITSDVGRKSVSKRLLWRQDGEQQQHCLVTPLRPAPAAPTHLSLTITKNAATTAACPLHHNHNSDNITNSNPINHDHCNSYSCKRLWLRFQLWLYLRKPHDLHR